METLEEWNQYVKNYLKRTDKKDYTDTDVLVSQIIEASETESEERNPIDLNALYDLEFDELLRIVEREYNHMQARVIVARRRDAYKQSRSKG